MLDPVLRRIRVDEWMDDPDLDPVRHQSALAGLRRLNRFSQVSAVFYRQLRRLARQTPDRPLHVLDIASGSADLPIDWLCRARRDGIALSVTALDRSDFAIRTAVQAAKEADVSLGTMCRNCLTEALPSRFDVVTCSLFMHHLDPPDVSRLIQEMWRVCEGTLIICDLERSRTNLAMVAAASRLLSRSDIVHHDAGRKRTRCVHAPRVCWNVGVFTRVQRAREAVFPLSLLGNRRPSLRGGVCSRHDARRCRRDVLSEPGSGKANGMNGFVL